PNVEKEIQRLDGMLQRTRRLDNYRQQLTLRIQEIKPICREVFQRLQEMYDTGQEDENVLFIVENFLQNRLAANDFTRPSTIPGRVENPVTIEPSSLSLRKHVCHNGPLTPTNRSFLVGGCDGHKCP